MARTRGTTLERTISDGAYGSFFIPDEIGAERALESARPLFRHAGQRLPSVNEVLEEWQDQPEAESPTWRADFVVAPVIQNGPAWKALYSSVLGRPHTLMLTKYVRCTPEAVDIERGWSADFLPAHMPEYVEQRFTHRPEVATYLAAQLSRIIEGNPVLDAELGAATVLREEVMVSDGMPVARLQPGLAVGFWNNRSHAVQIGAQGKSGLGIR